MARPDVLIQKQNSFEEIQVRLNELALDNQRKLGLDSVEPIVNQLSTDDTKPKTQAMKSAVVDVQVEDDYEFDL